MEIWEMGGELKKGMKIGKVGRGMFGRRQRPLLGKETDHLSPIANQFHCLNTEFRVLNS